MSITKKILRDHRLESDEAADEEVAVSVDQVYTHDNTGTMVYLQFEALGVDEIQIDNAVTYHDHNSHEFFEEQSQDHDLLRSATKKYGSHHSKTGNGICHQVHRERFAKPGEIILASDSHTPTLGGLGALGIGAGGMDVAATMAGYPFFITEPEVVNVKLTGELPTAVSAKDVILSIVNELSIKGGIGKVFEFTGPGVSSLSVPERCTITNMTTELGATGGIFPSDEVTREYLDRQGRESDWEPIHPEGGAGYDDELRINLNEIEPVVAEPGMPDNLAPVGSVDSVEVDQVLVGSCTNGSFADIAPMVGILKGRQVHPDVDFVIYPASKRTVETLAKEGLLTDLMEAGASISESTCGACIGNGHIPSPGSVSLRTFNRNYPGRSGLQDDSVYLCSPEVAAASAVTGKITDPQDLIEGDYDRSTEPEKYSSSDAGIVFNEPDPDQELIKGENIASIPVKDELEDQIEAPVGIKLGDGITTDHLTPAKADHYRSNIPKLAEYTLSGVDASYTERAKEAGSSIIVAGENYGQGSSREHAALAPLQLGVEAVIAKGFARIHENNLINFGILPLVFQSRDSYDQVQQDDVLSIDRMHSGIDEGTIEVYNVTKDLEFTTRLDVSDRQREFLKAGGKLPYIRTDV